MFLALLVTLCQLSRSVTVHDAWLLAGDVSSKCYRS